MNFTSEIDGLEIPSFHLGESTSGMDLECAQELFDNAELIVPTRGESGDKYVVAYDLNSSEPKYALVTTQTTINPVDGFPRTSVLRAIPIQSPEDAGVVLDVNQLTQQVA